jgi:dTDP-4-dehydrorhamnose reductase
VEIIGYKLKIVVTGGDGLLGRTFQKHLSMNGNHITAVMPKSELDVTNRVSIRLALEKDRPDWLVNCAAFTNVDYAELNPSIAFNVNSNAIKDIAEVASELNIRVLHFSTDYVFDGLTAHPYLEKSETNPLNQYGQSKLEGERNLLRIMPENALVVRTAWLYGSLKSGFLSQVINRVQSGEKVIQLIDDQLGQLTLASDVVHASMKILDRYRTFSSRVLHITNQGLGSWQEIGELINQTLEGRSQIQGISHKELDRPALRPNFSALDSGKFSAEFGAMRNWTEALEEYLIKQKRAKGT